ncbi:MAG: CatB-related O-acetyltransferase [Tissierella sp.]|nr:CatB-related O-acetyltransferase [Tissierella sp.]
MKVLYYVSKLIKKLHLPAIKEAQIDDTSRICSGSHIVNSSVDRYSYIGNFCTVINTEIGSFCSIADNTIIGGANHPIEWVSTSPVFHSGKNIMKKNFSTHDYNTTKRTIIGNDVWIGNNCLIKSGVEIGNGAIIAMGSIVTKNVGDYEIWGGNPARMIRKRFNNQTITQLIEVGWWNWDDITLHQKAYLFNDVEEFLGK